MLKVESQFFSEFAVQTSKKKIKTKSHTLKNNIKNQIKKEISLKIKQKSYTKSKFKKSIDSLKCTMTEMKKNEKNLFTIEELLMQLSNSHFQFISSFLVNCTRVDVKALRMYKEKEK